MATKKKKSSKVEMSVSVKEVEAAEPCTDSYFSVLRKLKSFPDKEGKFWDVWTSQGKKIGKSRYGPDDQVPLATIAESDVYYVQWLINNAPKFEDVRTIIEGESERLSEILYLTAIQNYEDGKIPKKKG